MSYNNWLIATLMQQSIPFNLRLSKQTISQFSQSSPKKLHIDEWLFKDQLKILKQLVEFKKIDPHSHQQNVFSPAYLAIRPALFKQLFNLSKIFKVSLHCVQHSFRIVDHFLLSTSIIPPEEDYSLLNLTCLGISCKFMTEMDCDVQEMCDYFYLRTQDMVLLEKRILDTLDYKLILPTISSIYDTLYQSESLQHLPTFIKSSELVNQELIYLTMSLRILQKQSEHESTGFQEKWSQESIVSDVKKIVNALRSEIASKLK